MAKLYVGAKVIIARPLPNPIEYRGCAEPHVGLEGKIVKRYKDLPDDCVAVEFFCGDLGYEAEGTRDKPDPDDMLRYGIKSDVLEVLPFVLGQVNT